MTRIRRPRLPRVRHAVALLGVLGALVAAGPAFARDGRDDGGDRVEVRATGTCDRGATIRLRLRARDGELRVNVEIDHARPRSRWRIAVVQERRVAWRGRARVAPGSRSTEIEPRLRDLPGADSVRARAWGPRGVTCAVAATLPG